MSYRVSISTDNTPTSEGKDAKQGSKSTENNEKKSTHRTLTEGHVQFAQYYRYYEVTCSLPEKLVANWRVTAEMPGVFFSCGLCSLRLVSLFMTHKPLGPWDPNW